LSEEFIVPYKNPDRMISSGVELSKRDRKDALFSNADFFDFRNGAMAMFEDFATATTGRGTMPNH